MKFAWYLSALILHGVLSPFVGAQEPQARGAIRGLVTLDDQPLPGLILALHREDNNRGSQLVARAETDAEGKYLFVGIPAGNYFLSQLSPHLVPVKDESFGYAVRKFRLADGETIENVNVALQRGGVVTGKILDADGYPLIRQMVSFERVGQNGGALPTNQGAAALRGTDDRGIYRLFGLFPGRYRIYIGDRFYARASSSFASQGQPLTFHPGVTAVERAKIIEVTAGSETSDVDIKLSTAERAYQVVGRVVDAQTGSPLPGVRVGYRTDGGFTVSEIRTNDRGEFRYENFPPGSYHFYARLNNQSEYYSERTPVEVKDRDVEGVVIKAQRGSSISGWVTFEGVPESSILAQIPELIIAPFLRRKERTSREGQYRIGANGSFTFSGLEPGNYGFRVISLSGTTQSFNVIRVEHQGAVKNGIDVTPGKDLTDIRVVIGIGTGSIRGQVRPDVDSVELPIGAYMHVTAKPARDVGYVQGGSARADRQGSFIIEGIAPGEYEVSVTLGFDDKPQRNLYIHRNVRAVVVTSGKYSEVILPVEIFIQGPQ